MQAAELPRQVEAGAGGGRGGHRRWVRAGGVCPWLAAARRRVPPVGSGLQAAAPWRRATLARGSAHWWQLVGSGCCGEAVRRAAGSHATRKEFKEVLLSGKTRFTIDFWIIDNNFPSHPHSLCCVRTAAPFSGFSFL